MFLRDFVPLFGSARDVSAGYLDQLYWAVHGLEKFARRRIDSSDLTHDLLNAYLRWMREHGRSTETRRSRRRNLLILWRAMADLGLAAEPIGRRVMRICGCDRITMAWTFDEALQLDAVALRLPGKYSNGVPRALYWDSYIRAAWDSALRGCDLRSFEHDWIPPHRRVVVVQRKTRKRIIIQFHKSTIEAIERTFPPHRAMIWPLWASLDRWRREAKMIVRRAGLKGSIGKLRHSSGTAVELIARGQGHEHLGNTREVFERHYLDHSQLLDTRPLPPEIPPA